MNSDKTTPTPGPYTIQEGNNACLIWGAAPDHNADLIGRTDRTVGTLPNDQQHIVNARLLASSWAFLAACTPERLQALDDIIARIGAEDSGDGAEAVAGMMQYAHLMDLAQCLRAAVAAAAGSGEEVTT